MWFAFGFITLISFSIYFGVQGRKARWKGSLASHRSTDYEYLFEIKKGKVQNFKVGIAAPREYDFSFKREDGFDRLCKFLGLSVEHQVGSEEFDWLVYVVSNDRHLMRQLSPHDGLTHSVLGLFKLQRFESQVEEVRCQHGRLWATFSVRGRLWDEASGVEQLRQILPTTADLLAQVVNQLVSRPAANPGKRRDPFVLRAAVLLAISTGMAVNGVLHFLRLLWNTSGFAVDLSLLWRLSVYSSVAVVVLLVLVAVTLLGRSARTHLVLIELVLVGSLGATLTLFTELRDLNMEMDSSVVTRIETSVQDKHIKRSRRSGTQYVVNVKDWTHSQNWREIQVPSDFYDQIKVGDGMEIRQRAGFLGVRWVESFERAPAQD